MKNLDKKIKELVYDAEMHVSPSVWDAIDARIDSKPEKPRYWFLFLMSAFAIPIALVTYHKVSDSAQELDKSAYTQDVNSILPQDQKVHLRTIENTQVAESNITQKVSSVTKSKESVQKKRYNKKLTESPTEVIIENIERVTTPSLDNFISTDDSEEGLGLSPVLLKFGKIAAVPELAVLNQGLEVNQIDEDGFLNIFSSSPKCPSFSKKPKGLYAWTDVVSSYPFQSLSSLEGGDGSWKSLREGSEHGLVSFSFGAGMGIILPHGFFVESGLNYDLTRLALDFSKNDGYEVEETDGGLVHVPGYQYIYSVNTFKQVEVPLLFGYEMPLLPSYNLNVKVGPVFNLSSTSEGKILNANEETQDFNVYNQGAISDQLYNSRFSVAYAAGINLMKDFNDHISFSVGLNVKHYKHINSTTNPISESITKVGLSTGLRYRL